MPPRYYLEWDVTPKSQQRLIIAAGVKLGCSTLVFLLHNQELKPVSLKTLLEAFEMEVWEIAFQESSALSEDNYLIVSGLDELFAGSAPADEPEQFVHVVSCGLHALASAVRYFRREPQATFLEAVGAYTNFWELLAGYAE